MPVRHVLHFPFLVLLVAAASAQKVELEVPEQLILDNSRLSVAIMEGVTEVHARQALAALDVEILEVRFSPGTISGYTQVHGLDSLLANLRIQFPTLTHRAYPIEMADGTPARVVRLWFPPETSRAQMLEIAAGLTWLEDRRVYRPENDILIRIGASPDPLIERLELLDEVAYTAFVPLPAVEVN